MLVSGKGERTQQFKHLLFHALVSHTTLKIQETAPKLCHLEKKDVGHNQHNFFLRYLLLILIN